MVGLWRSIDFDYNDFEDVEIIDFWLFMYYFVCICVFVVGIFVDFVTC